MGPACSKRPRHAVVLLATLAAALPGCSRAAAIRGATVATGRSKPASLPEGPLIIGYQNWAACNLTETMMAVERGVNVVIWFAINLLKDEETQQPVVKSGPSYTCVADVRAAIEARALPTVHLISIGGWDAPHPDTSFSGTEWFAAWDTWNQALPAPFDGFDWDLEGNDKESSRYNDFTLPVTDLVIDMSIAAKAKGLIVTMVPAQSYFDVTAYDFNLSLKNTYPHWHPELHYRGRNCYAYLWTAAPPKTFDLVTVQLYETWSRASQARHEGQSGADYLRTWTDAVLSGWTVNFSNISQRLQGHHDVMVDPSALVIGLSFGGASGKSVFFWPEEAELAYKAAAPERRPRGYAFWNIALDIASRANGTDQVVHLAEGLNKFLGIRHRPESEVEV